MVVKDQMLTQPEGAPACVAPQSLAAIFFVKVILGHMQLRCWPHLDLWVMGENKPAVWPTEMGENKPAVWPTEMG